MDILLNILDGQGYSAAELELIKQSFILLLMLPIVATITGVFRYIIGFKSLSIYAPIALTFAFYQLGFIQADGETNILRGLKFGLFLYAVVFIATVLTYKLFKGLRMHYIPKATSVLTAVSVSLILSIFILTLLFNKNGFIYLDILSIIIITTLSDTFISLLSRKKARDVAKIGLQTLFISVISYILISSTWIRDIIVDYSILVVVALFLINLYVGKFVGLRITEYWRFRELLLQDTGSNVKPKPDQKK